MDDEKKVKVVKLEPEKPIPEPLSVDPRLTKSRLLRLNGYVATAYRFSA